MENIKYVQVKDPDSGALSESYLLEVEAQNVIFEDKENLVEKMAKKSDKAIYGDNEVNLGRIEDSEKGLNSITLGTENIASGDYSTATGYNTIAVGDHSHVEGRYNIEDTENRYAFIIGNGYLPEVTEEVPSPDPIRSNAFAVDWEGKVYAKTFINGDGAELYPSLKSIFVNDVEYNLNGGSLILQAGDNITLTPGTLEGSDNEDIVDGNLTIVISSTGGGPGAGGGDGEYLPLAGGKVYGPVIIERDMEKVPELEDENGNYFSGALRIRNKNNNFDYLDISHNSITKTGGDKTLGLNKVSGYVQIGKYIFFDSDKGSGGSGWLKTRSSSRAFQWGSDGCSAMGNYSQTFGYETSTEGSYSTAKGFFSRAIGNSSSAEGASTTANGDHSHAEGYWSYANGEASHAEGYLSIAHGQGSHAEGYHSSTISYDDILEQDLKNYIFEKWNESNEEATDDLDLYNKFGIAYGKGSHIQGRDCLALGDYSSAKGIQTVANGEGAEAGGKGSVAFGKIATVDGYQCVVNGSYTYANGYQCTAFGRNSESRGYKSSVHGEFSYINGNNNFLQGDYSFLFGLKNIVKGEKCFVVGENNDLNLTENSIILGSNINICHQTIRDGYRPTWNTWVDDLSITNYTHNGFIMGKDIKFFIKSHITEESDMTVSYDTPNGSLIALGKNLSINIEYDGGPSFNAPTNNILLGENNHIYCGYIANSNSYENMVYSNACATENVIIGKNNNITGARAYGHYIFGFENTISKDQKFGTTDWKKEDESMESRFEPGFGSETECGGFILGQNNQLISCNGTTIIGYDNIVTNANRGSYIEGRSHNLFFRHKSNNSMTSDNGVNHIEGFAHQLKGIGLINCHLEGSEHQLLHTTELTDSRTDRHTTLFNSHIEGYKHIFIPSEKDTTGETSVSYPNVSNLHLEGINNKIYGNIQYTYHIEGRDHEVGHSWTWQNSSESFSMHIEGTGNKFDAFNSQYWDHGISGLGGNHIEGYQNLFVIDWINYVQGIHIEGMRNNLIANQGRANAYECYHVEGFANNYFHQGIATHIEGAENIITDSLVGGSHIGGRRNKIALQKFGWESNFIYCEGYECNFGQDESYIKEVENLRLTSEEYFALPEREWENYYCDIYQSHYNELSYSYKMGKQWFCIDTGNIYHGNNLYTGPNTVSRGGNYLHIEGLENSHRVEGNYSHYDGVVGHIEGCKNVLLGGKQGGAFHIEGYENQAQSFNHVEGYRNIAIGRYSHAEGERVIVTGQSAHAEGIGTYTDNSYDYMIKFEDIDYSYENWIVNKNFVMAAGLGSHAEGYCTYAEGEGAHAEGMRTYAKEVGTHAEGSTTQALGHFTHAQNIQTIAEGAGSHAGGYLSKALGTYSFAHGDNIVAASKNQFVIGRYNIEDVDEEYAFILGNGGLLVDEETGETTDEIIYSNAFTIDWDGKVSATLFNGAINTHKIGNADFNGTQDITLENIGVYSKEEINTILKDYILKKDAIISLEIKEEENQLIYTKGDGKETVLDLPVSSGGGNGDIIVTKLSIGTIITNDNPDSSGFDYGQWECLGKNTMLLTSTDESSTEVTEVITYVWKRVEEEEIIIELPIGTIVTNDNPNGAGFSYGEWECLGKNTMILSSIDETSSNFTEIINYIWKRIK